MPGSDEVEEVDFTHVEDLVPEGGYPEMAFRVVGYLDADGNPMINDDFQGNVPLGHSFGVVLLSLFATWHERLHAERD